MQQLASICGLRAERSTPPGLTQIPSSANLVAILQLRLYWGWSQRELGRRAGVSQSVISRIESGAQQGVSLRRTFAILRALRVGEIRMLPRPPAIEMTNLELLLHGDPWLRAIAAAEHRLNRRRSA